MESQASFVRLRDEILEAVQPLLVSDAIGPEERLELTLRLAQVRRDPVLYQQAFDLIGTLENSEEKLSKYMQLLDDVEFELADNENDDSMSDEAPLDSPSEHHDQSQEAH